MVSGSARVFSLTGRENFLHVLFRGNFTLTSAPGGVAGKGQRRGESHALPGSSDALDRVFPRLRLRRQLAPFYLQDVDLVGEALQQVPASRAEPETPVHPSRERW